MTAPAEVLERIARTWKAGGGIVLTAVSVCRTEAGANRVARKYPLAEIKRNPDGTLTVWAVRDA